MQSESIKVTTNQKKKKRKKNRNQAYEDGELGYSRYEQKKFVESKGVQIKPFEFNNK